MNPKSIAFSARFAIIGASLTGSCTQTLSARDVKNGFADFVLAIRTGFELDTIAVGLTQGVVA